MPSYSKTQCALLNAKTSSEALGELYQVKKAKAKNLSLARFCSHTGISSKGYLSDVLKGKRTLNMKYLEGVTKALNLTGASAEYLKALLERDLCNDPNTKKVWDRLIESLAKSFEVVETSAPIPKDTDLIEFEVFCAFGLFAGAPKRRDLVNYFGKTKAFEVDRALFRLEQRGWIEIISAKGAVEKQWRLVVSQIAFVDDKENMSHEDFLRQAIIAAADNVQKWYGDRETAHFESFIISVHDATFRKELSSFKDSLIAWQSKFEATDGNRLIRFNTQVYPIR